MMEGTSASTPSFTLSAIQIYFIDIYLFNVNYVIVKNRLTYNFFGGGCLTCNTHFNPS